MVLKSHTPMLGKKSFQASTPRLWNKLINYIKLAASKEIFVSFLKPVYLH